MKRVLVLMSGGVDSSVSAALLKKQGFDVLGLTLRLLPKNTQTSPPSSCCGSPKDIFDAKTVCNTIGIKHYVMDYTDVFHKTVIDDFLNKYISGKTPNPCINCNRFIKFNDVFNLIKLWNCDFLATGHYAQIKKTPDNYYLYPAKDSSKDQSYFLYMLIQEKLKRLIFPVGILTKSQVRKIAKEFKLPVHNKKDSQDICFIINNDYRSFFNNYHNENSGEIYDDEGKVIGYHNGVFNYTIGQRIGLSNPPKKFIGKRTYVTKIEENKITVGTIEKLYRNDCFVKNVNLIIPQEKNFKALVKIRYKNPWSLANCKIIGEKIKVNFLKSQIAITPGQYAVFYEPEKKYVIGGGEIV